MKRISFFFISCIANFTTVTAQIPKVSTGTIKRFENFSSKYVVPRNIDVWLPENYSSKKKYPVLYMHDGRSLFDSSIVWNHQEWGVDEVLGKMMTQKKMRECIVVGIWNAEALRHMEYFPQKPFETLSKVQQDSIFIANRSNGKSVFKVDSLRSDNYLQFLVKELKPFIDRTFSTLRGRSNTFVAGSSMGGLISLYAICEYPDIFGGAACLSTHWPGVFTTVNNPIPGAFIQYMHTHLPPPQTHRIYFDYGSATLDAMYKPYQQQADVVMQQKGYSASNWITREFPGDDHSETSWNRRLHIPVLFLLGK
jgi:enterochelin esterase-like enzyme